MQKTERTVEEITQRLEKQLDAAWERYEQVAKIGSQSTLNYLNGRITTLENTLTFIDGVPRD